MLAALALAFSLVAPTPPTHHVALHVGSRAKIKLYDPHVRNWSITRAAVVSVSNVRSVHKETTMVLTGVAAGSAALTVGCDAGRIEVWLVDVS